MSGSTTGRNTARTGRVHSTVISATAAAVTAGSPGGVWIHGRSYHSRKRDDLITKPCSGQPYIVPAPSVVDHSRRPGTQARKQAVSSAGPNSAGVVRRPHQGDTPRPATLPRWYSRPASNPGATAYAVTAGGAAHGPNGPQTWTGRPSAPGRRGWHAVRRGDEPPGRRASRSASSLPRQAPGRGGGPPAAEGEPCRRGPGTGWLSLRSAPGPSHRASVAASRSASGPSGPPGSRRWPPGPSRSRHLPSGPP